MSTHALNDIPYDLIVDIKQKAGFPEEFDFHKEITSIQYHLEYHMPKLAQIPRKPAAIKKFKVMAEESRALLNMLEQIIPLILEACDSIHEKVYPHKIYANFQSSTQYIENNIRNLRAICHSLKSKIDDHSYEKILTVINNLLSCFSKSKVTTTTKINEVKVYCNNCDITVATYLSVKIPVENVTTDHGGFINSIKYTMNILIAACETIIDEINNGKSILYLRPGRGRNFEMKRSNVILMLASIYERATGEAPRAGYDDLTGGYVGNFYEFILECSPLFKLLGTPLPLKELAIGKLLLEILPHYRVLTEHA